VQAAAFETTAPQGEFSAADSPLPRPERGQTIAALSISAVRIQPQDAPPKPPEEVPAPSGMKLHEAIEISLWQNPDLVSMRQAEGVSLAAVGVAQTYPFNPFVQTQLFPSPRNKLGRTEAPAYYVWLMQTLELAHQRSYREQNANAALNQVRWNIHQAELLNMAQTERLFFSAVYQRQVRDLTRNAADLNERMVGVLERRFSANQTAAANVTMARITSRSSQRQADLAETTYQTALLALRQQLKLHPTEPLHVTGDLSKWHWLPIGQAEEKGPATVPPESLQHTAEELVAGRPDIMAAQSDLVAAFANYRLARANRIPNVGVGPIYDQDEAGTQFWGFRTQVNLPVWDTGRPLANQRLAEVNQRQTIVQQLQERAAIEAYAAIDRYERARRLATHTPSDISTEFPEELRQVEAQYQAGQADLLNVFATQVSLVQDYRAHLDLLNEVAQAAAAVTASTGLPPHDVVKIE
jgi:outer membrane protein, heavy metal efflux system